MSVTGLRGEAAPAPDVELIVAFVEQFGVPVFPCRPNDKKPATPRGFKDASRDTAQIRRWAAEIRNANWGMPTGTASGILAVDVDVRPEEGKRGDETIARLQREHGPLPETTIVLTPSGGTHYWLRAPSAVSGGAAEKLGSGLDVKADGGYIVIPPSQINGRAYAFEASSDPADVGIAEAPAWLLDLLATKPEPEPKGEEQGEGRAAGWIANIRAGTALHDSLRDLAAHYAAGGVAFAEIVALLEGLMHGSKAPRDERWRERFGSIPKLVNSAVEKFRAAKAAGPAPRLVDMHDFLAEAPAPFYIVDRILQRGYVYALTAYWGHGKTAAMIAVALHVAAGLQFGVHRVARQRVAVLCGENPDDTKLRVRLAAEELGLEWGDLEGWLYFTEKPFAIDNALALGGFIAENQARGPFGLIVVDTGPAHSEAEEENSNREQHTLATALRELLQGFGGPCVVVLMHPSKTATRENMQPRGGGAFSGGIDGELCLWRDVGSDLIELYHRTKFRGPGFEPIMLRLEKREASDVRDNFGGAAVTVIAKLTDERATASAGKRRLSDSERVSLDALRRCLANGSGKAVAVPPEVRRAAGMGTSTSTLVETWRHACYAARISDSENQETLQKAFRRAALSLQAARIVATHNDYVWIPGEPNLAPDHER